MPSRPATIASRRPVSSNRRRHHVERDRSDLGLQAQKDCIRTVGNYAIGHVLGEGSFGKVRLGTHVITGENVAVKILEKSRVVEAADVQRVAREIKILKRNNHRNIIQLFEVLDAPNAIYLIMENANAGEMFSYIVKHKRVAESQACTFFHQIIDGADYLHSMEVTHRDLKPENLLLQTSRKFGYIVKIVDFGLSNTHDGGRLLQTACGSPCYAAPEMIAGKRYCGPKADIWSMGVILYALVCGYLPFEHQNTSVLYKKIMTGSYSTPKWMSRDVADLICRILNTDPEGRYSIPDIRRHPWYAYVEIQKIPVHVHGVSFGVTRGTDAWEKTLPKISLDKRVLTQMKELLKLSPQFVADNLAAGAHNNVTTTYHLLVQKLFRLADFKTDETCELVIAVSEDYMRYRRRSAAAVAAAATAQEDRQQVSLTDLSRGIKPIQTIKPVSPPLARLGSNPPALNEERGVVVSQRDMGSQLVRLERERVPLACTPSSMSSMQAARDEGVEGRPSKSVITSSVRLSQTGSATASSTLTHAVAFRDKYATLGGCVGGTRTRSFFNQTRPTTTGSKWHSQRQYITGGVANFDLPVTRVPRRKH